MFFLYFSHDRNLFKLFYLKIIGYWRADYNRFYLFNRKCDRSGAVVNQLKYHIFDLLYVWHNVLMGEMEERKD